MIFSPPLVVENRTMPARADEAVLASLAIIPRELQQLQDAQGAFRQPGNRQETKIARVENEGKPKETQHKPKETMTN